MLAWRRLRRLRPPPGGFKLLQRVLSPLPRRRPLRRWWARRGLRGVHLRHRLRRLRRSRRTRLHTAAGAAAIAAIAAIAAARLQFGIEWCRLSRQRVYHRQRPRVPGVDEPGAAHARSHADLQTEQRPGRPQLLSQPGRKTRRALVLHDGPFRALGVMQPDPRVSALAAAALVAAALAATVTSSTNPTSAPTSPSANRTVGSASNGAWVSRRGGAPGEPVDACCGGRRGL